MGNHIEKLIIAVGLACLSACGMPTGEGESSAIIEVPPDTQPLAVFASSDWEEVDDDCEGKIPERVEFQIVTSNRLVAVDDSGMPVCSDSVEDVQEELQATGRYDEAQDVWQSYLVALGLAVPGIANGDPSPQPSTLPSMRTNPGDPHDTEGMNAGDPSPQPS